MDKTDETVPLIHYVTQEKMDSIQLIDYTDGDFTTEEQYQIALESIFRWTLRRDECTDAQIVKAIKKVAMVALEDV